MIAIFRLPVIAGLALIAAGCASGPDQIAMAPAPAPVIAYTPPPQPLPQVASPINRALSTSGAVWHLRVGLNVAALACRGPREAAIIADYNALLATQKAELANAQASLTTEYRDRFGKTWQDAQDDAMTRLYNFFSQAQAREDFCAAAADVLAETRMLPAGALPAIAATRLRTIDAPFAREFAPTPRIAVNVAALGGS